MQWSGDERCNEFLLGRFFGEVITFTALFQKRKVYSLFHERKFY